MNATASCKRSRLVNISILEGLMESERDLPQNATNVEQKEWLHVQRRERTNVKKRSLGLFEAFYCRSHFYCRVRQRKKVSSIGNGSVLFKTPMTPNKVSLVSSYSLHVSSKSGYSNNAAHNRHKREHRDGGVSCNMRPSHSCAAVPSTTRLT